MSSTPATRRAGSRVTRTTSSVKKSSSNASISAAAPPSASQSQSASSVDVDDEDEQSENDSVDSASHTTPYSKSSSSSSISSASSGSRSTPSTAGLDTPARTARLKEKSDLAELNKRLEFYILRQRERDASSDGHGREVALIREKAAADLLHAKSLYEAQLTLVRKSRDEQTLNAAKLEAEIARREGEIKDLTAQLSASERARTQYETRNQQLSSDLVSAQTGFQNANAQIKQLKHDLMVSENKNSDLSETLEEARQRAETAEKENAISRAQLSDLQADHRQLELHSTGESTRLQKEITRLIDQATRSGEDVRSDFDSRVIEMWATRQAKADADKNAALAALKTTYDDKIYGYRTQLEAAGHEVEKERSRARRLEDFLNSEQAKLGELLSERDALLTQVRLLEGKLENEKSNPELQRIIYEKTEIIRRIKQSFKRKDQEFDELMDVKIMLDMEIKAYRAMIEAEEDRLGYASPIKKRRRTGTTLVASAPVRTSLPSPLVITGMDLEGGHITVRNSSTEGLDLSGWKLRSAYSKAEFLFPSIRLRPGDSFTVYTQEAWNALNSEEQGGKAEEGTHRAVWDTPIVFSSSGDQAQLLNPNSELVGSVEIIPVSNYTSTYKLETSESSFSSSSSSSVGSSFSSGDETSNETQNGETKTEDEEKKCVIM